MRPGSNGIIARPCSREQHSARLNARPHKRVNVRKPFIVRVRARFACARDTMKVCLHITFACVISFAVSLVLFGVLSSWKENVRAFCAVRSLDAKNVWLPL